MSELSPDKRHESALHSFSMREAIKDGLSPDTRLVHWSDARALEMALASTPSNEQTIAAPQAPGSATTGGVPTTFATPDGAALSTTRRSDRCDSCGYTESHDPNCPKLKPWQSPEEKALPKDVQEAIRKLLEDFGEIPDRTSPDDFPEGYVLTRHEIVGGILQIIEADRTSRSATPCSADIEKAWQMLEVCGVSRERARGNLARGIEVLSSRLAKEEWFQKAMEADAARWRALFGCSRIRVLGYARGGPEGKDGPIRHIGFEFTTDQEPYCDLELKDGKDRLTEFTDAVMNSPDGGKEQS